MSFLHVPISARCKALWLGNLASGRDLPNKASLEKSNGSGNQHLFLYTVKKQIYTILPVSHLCPFKAPKELSSSMGLTTFWKQKTVSSRSRFTQMWNWRLRGVFPHFHHDLLAFIDIECKVSPPQDFLCHWMSNLSGFFGGNLDRACQSSCLGWVTPSRNYTAYGKGGPLVDIDSSNHMEDWCIHLGGRRVCFCGRSGW